MSVTAINAAESIEGYIRNISTIDNVSEESIQSGFKSGIWSSERNAYAIVFKKPNGSLCLVLLKQGDGYKVIDVSSVETGNFGKLGYNRAYYDNYETVPTKWYKSKNDNYQIEFTSHAWKNGNRFTIREPLIIKNNGTPIYR